MKSSASISEVLSGFVPAQDLMILSTADRAGQLSMGLRLLISMNEKMEEIKLLFIQSIIAPSILFVLVIIVIIGYSQKVFPTFLEIVPLSQWPPLTKNLFNTGTYLASGGVLVISIILICLIAGIVLSLPLAYGNFRTRYMDKFPPYNYYRHFQMGVFLHVVSALLKTGVPMVEAIDLIKQRASPWLRYHLEIINFNMKMGKNYKDSLNTGFLSTDILLTIKIYTGLESFTNTISKMAEKSDITIVARINKLTSILRNVSLLTLALVVVWVLTAIFSLIDQVGAKF